VRVCECLWWLLLPWGHQVYSNMFSRRGRVFSILR